MRFERENKMNIQNTQDLYDYVIREMNKAEAMAEVHQHIERSHQFYKGQADSLRDVAARMVIWLGCTATTAKQPSATIIIAPDEAAAMKIAQEHISPVIPNERLIDPHKDPMCEAGFPHSRE